MDRNETLEYLSYIIDQYLEIEMYEKLIAKLDRKMGEIDDVLYRLTTQSHYEEREFVSADEPGFSENYCLQSLGCLVPLTFVLALFSETMAVISVTVIAGLVIAGVIKAVRDGKRKREYRAQLESVQRRNADMNRTRRAQYEREKAEAINRKRREKAGIATELRNARTGKAEAESALQRLYDMGIIYDRYRTRASVIFLFDYFSSRTSPSWDRAYDGVDFERRGSELTERLDVIGTRLQEISRAVSRFGEGIYTSIGDVNVTVGRLYSSIEEGISSTTNRLDAIGRGISAGNAIGVVNAYNIERARRELAHMNRMDYLAGTYDEVWDNRPPSYR